MRKVTWKTPHKFLINIIKHHSVNYFFHLWLNIGVGYYVMYSKRLMNIKSIYEDERVRLVSNNSDFKVRTIHSISFIQPQECPCDSFEYIRWFPRFLRIRNWFPALRKIAAVDNSKDIMDLSARINLFLFLNLHWRNRWRWFLRFEECVLLI